MRLKKLEYKKLQRQKLIRLFGILFLVLSGLLYIGYHLDSVQRKMFYPYPYQETVEKYAIKYRVDSSLCASVINKESKFKNEAESHRGALGLMQLMPETAKWIAEQIHEKDFTVEKLRDPETNIRFGVWYLSSLQSEFKYNETLMLAAYNAGRGNVHEWMEEYGWDYEFNEPKRIPFDETKEYVADVIKGKAKYRKLYHHKVPVP